MSLTNLRLGLCCTFRDEPIKFYRALATPTLRLSRAEALEKVAALCAANAKSLHAALVYCAAKGIGSFRINSQFLPLKAHPELGYDLGELPGGPQIVQQLVECGRYAREQNIRTCFHPDQFVVLNSPRPAVVKASLLELEYQAEVAEWVNADVINVHAGGAYGDKVSALRQLSLGLEQLSDRARARLTVENDDRTFTPADLLPWCRSENIPLVYDVHHHRCNPDTDSIEKTTDSAIETWNREPLFHISSPVAGWGQRYPERHHDFVDPDDFPACWLDRQLTVEVEAKAKEVAVLRLMSDLRSRGAPTGSAESGSKTSSWISKTS